MMSLQKRDQVKQQVDQSKKTLIQFTNPTTWGQQETRERELHTCPFNEQWLPVCNCGPNSMPEFDKILAIPQDWDGLGKSKKGE